MMVLAIASTRSLKAPIVFAMTLIVMLGGLVCVLVAAVAAEQFTAAVAEATAAVEEAESYAGETPAVIGGACADASTPPSGAADVLDAEQVGNARIIIDVTAATGLSSRAAVIAVATAMQESSLRNVNHGDRAGPDSRGLFQQRLQFYAAEGDPMNPRTATEMFLRRIVKVRNWERRPLTVVAQAVQISAHPNAYARWEALATDLVTQYWTTPC